MVHKIYSLVITQQKRKTFSNDKQKIEEREGERESDRKGDRRR